MRIHFDNIASDGGGRNPTAEHDGCSTLDVIGARRHHDHSACQCRRPSGGTLATFAYDAAGNRTKTENAAVTVTVTYDGTNRRDDVTTEYKT